MIKLAVIRVITLEDYLQFLLYAMKMRWKIDYFDYNFFKQTNKNGTTTSILTIYNNVPYCTFRVYAMY